MTVCINGSKLNVQGLGNVINYDIVDFGLLHFYFASTEFRWKCFVNKIYYTKIL